MKSLCIGNFKIPSSIIAAPLSGISDYPFRKITRQSGGILCYSEMISAEALRYGNRRTLNLTSFPEDDHPLAAQLLGNEVESLVKGAQYLIKAGADIIDLNLGCSVRKVLKLSQGSALLKNPALLQRIIVNLREKITCPLTVKMRKTWDGKWDTLLNLAQMLEKEGVDAIILHGRSPQQGFGGECDWDTIIRLSQVLNIPVIGNGNIRSLEEAQSKLSFVKGIMIGRELIGNPWFFQAKKPAKTEKLKTIILHIELINQWYPPSVALPIIKKHTAWYIKGEKENRKFKLKLFQCKEVSTIIELIKSYFNTQLKEI